MKPFSTNRRPMTVAAAAFASALIAVAILGSVTGLFQSRGQPMAELAAAERACATQAYVSAREACMRDVAEIVHGQRVAER